MQNNRKGFGAWLKSVGNRRVHSRKKRQEMHQLDVKVNSRKARRRRNSRKAGWLLKVGAVAVLIVSASVAVKWVYRQIFFENSEFKLNRLSIVTDGALMESDVSSAARLRLGMNLMEIDLKEVQNRILELPMVTKATVSRELPDRLEILVEERVPVAWLASPRHNIPPRNAASGFLMDGEGRVFRCRHLLKRFMNLPVIGTNDIPKPAENSIIESPGVKSSLELIVKNAAMFEGSGLELNLVKLINSWSLHGEYSNGMEVVFDPDELDRGLADLNQIVESAAIEGLELATVNVMVERNIPVTFYSSPEPAAMREMNRPVGGGEAGQTEAIRAVPVSTKELQLKSILNGG